MRGLTAGHYAGAPRSAGVCGWIGRGFQATHSTHVIQPCGAEILDEIGVLDAILAKVRCRWIASRWSTRMCAIDGTLDATHFATPGLCMRRVTLDALLVEAAATAGADVRTGCRVTRVFADDTGRVTGVQTDGPVKARVTVGADGRRSVIAASTGAAEYLVTLPDGYRCGLLLRRRHRRRTAVADPRAGEAIWHFSPARPTAASTWPESVSTSPKPATSTPTENAPSSPVWRNGRNWPTCWSARSRAGLPFA